MIAIKFTWCFVFFTAIFDTNFIQTYELINIYSYLLLLVENTIHIQWEIIWFCIYILTSLIFISSLFPTTVESELYSLAFMNDPVYIRLHH
jgi:hypothetical protein